MRKNIKYFANRAIAYLNNGETLALLTGLENAERLCLVRVGDPGKTKESKKVRIYYSAKDEEYFKNLIDNIMKTTKNQSNDSE